MREYQAGDSKPGQWDDVLFVGHVPDLGHSPDRIANRLPFSIATIEHKGNLFALMVLVRPIIVDHVEIVLAHIRKASDDVRVGWVGVEIENQRIKAWGLIKIAGVVSSKANAGNVRKTAVLVDTDVVGPEIATLRDEGDGSLGQVSIRRLGRTQSIQYRKVEDDDLRADYFGHEVSVMLECGGIAPDVKEIQGCLALDSAQEDGVGGIGDPHHGYAAGVGGQRIFFTGRRGPAPQVVHHTLGPLAGYRQCSQVVGRDLAEKLHILRLRERSLEHGQAGNRIIPGYELEGMRQGVVARIVGVDG